MRSMPIVLLLMLTTGVREIGAASLTMVSSASLPEGTNARDVRWAGPSEVYVSTGKGGVVRLRVDSASPAGVVMPPGAAGGPAVSGQVAVGDHHLFVGSQMGGLAWIPLRGGDRAVIEKGLLAVMDIDARGDQAAVLGADSGPLQGLARDGAIAWVGSLSKGLADMRPVMRGRSRPGGRDMARCGILETGAIRFMRDGSLVIAPGTEPGIYRYTSGMKLLQTWDTGPLGMVDDCSIEEEQLLLVARDFGARVSWWASRIVLDDILPLPEGPGLLLRRVEKGVTKWDLVTLPYRGKPERMTLPLSAPTPRAHLRGDVRGNEIVLLLFDDPLPRHKPVAPPRLVVLSIGVR